ncbi:MAG: hypothetical protein ACRCYS_13815 [Beijerinckiaceae bacterium]
MKAMLLPLALAACAPSNFVANSQGELIVRNMPGGIIAQYVKVFHDLEASGKRIRLGGDLTSAGTIYLGLSNFCIEGNAIFSFHGSQPRLKDPAKQLEQDMLMGDFYPPNIREHYIASWRFKGMHEYHNARGRDLVAMDPDYLQLCDEEG